MTETSEMRWARHNEAGRRFFSQGDLARAEAEFIAAVREAKSLGGDGLQLAISLGSLGQLRYRQRDFAQAEKLFRHALALREQALGANHPGIVQSLNNLAALHYTRGETSQAEPLFRRALAINEGELGVAHPELDVNLNNLAKLYVRARDFTSAEPLLQRLLALREQVKGSDNPETATVLVMLARARLALGAPAEAKALCMRALAIHEAVLPTGDSTLLATHKLLDEILTAHAAAAQPDPVPAPPARPAPEPDPEPVQQPAAPASPPIDSYVPSAPAPAPVDRGSPAVPREPPPLAAAPFGSFAPLPTDGPARDPSAYRRDEAAPNREREERSTPRPQFVPPPSWRPINAIVEPRATEAPVPPARDGWALDPREVADVPGPASGQAAIEPEPPPAPAAVPGDAPERHAPSTAAPMPERHAPAEPHVVDDDETTAFIDAELRARRRHRRPSRWRTSDISYRRVGLAVAGVMFVFTSAYLVLGYSGDATAGVPPADSAVAAAAAPRPVLGDFDRRLPSRPFDDARTTRSDAAMAEPSGDTLLDQDVDDFLMSGDAPLPSVRIQVDNVTRSIARTKARVDSLGREIPPEPIQFQRPPRRGP